MVPRESNEHSKSQMWDQNEEGVLAARNSQQNFASLHAAITSRRVSDDAIMNVWRLLARHGRECPGA